MHDCTSLATCPLPSAQHAPHSGHHHLVPSHLLLTFMGNASAGGMRWMGRGSESCSWKGRMRSGLRSVLPAGLVPPGLPSCDIPLTGSTTTRIAPVSNEVQGAANALPIGHRERPFRMGSPPPRARSGWLTQVFFNFSSNLIKKANVAAKSGSGLQPGDCEDCAELVLNPQQLGEQFESAYAVEQVRLNGIWDAPAGRRLQGAGLSASTSNSLAPTHRLASGPQAAPSSTHCSGSTGSRQWSRCGPERRGGAGSCGCDQGVDRRIRRGVGRRGCLRPQGPAVMPLLATPLTAPCHP